MKPNMVGSRVPLTAYTVTFEPNGCCLFINQEVNRNQLIYLRKLHYQEVNANQEPLPFTFP